MQQPMQSPLNPVYYNVVEDSTTASLSEHSCALLHRTHIEHI